MSNNKEYQKLKKLWYKKLKDDGFEDIEQDDAYGNLKTWSSKFARVSSLVEKQEYYIMATRFLNDYTFATKKDKIIWTHHSDGIGYRKIAKFLKNAGFKNVSPTNVHLRLVHLKNAMLQRYGVL